MAPVARNAAFQRYAPYSPKRPSLVEHEIYVEERIRACAPMDPVSFDNDFHRQLSLDDDEDLDPDLSVEWSRDEVAMFLTLYLDQ
ncbi:hypothetical protein ACHHYP_09943 [Achlya hypogyna]|uniref:Uncharacterized protein n=1 Tax=Achlya hypogyna TaxID=1202772 RepID=A0A1V9YM62_ACHHY|nr:hypothetical protein ACHHYP_09943 [Achlya hypogyna]